MDVCSSGSLAPFCHFVVHAHRVIPKTLMTPEVCLPACLPPYRPTHTTTRCLHAKPAYLTHFE
jgi:hypothetical protein